MKTSSSSFNISIEEDENKFKFVRHQLKQTMTQKRCLIPTWNHFRIASTMNEYMPNVTVLSMQDHTLDWDRPRPASLARRHGLDATLS